MRLFGCTVPRSAHIYGCPNLLRHEGKIILGERVMINSIRSIYRFGQSFNRTILSTKANGHIEIDDDAGINTCVIHSEKKVTIGKRVMIAGGCRITDADMHPVDQVPRRYVEDHDPQEVIIEDDVWLCADVQVGKGVRIGRGSVVGAKSMVTRDIPPNVLAGGIPARVIRPLHLGDQPNSDNGSHTYVTP